tara:strand:+ start:30 stop:326 length:297 start_codon:yes stop_codon:yes gene_type:complete
MMKHYIVLTLSLFLFIGCSQESSSKKDVPVKEVSETSEITCPDCGHVETEELPTTTCQIYYDCKGCGKTMTPKGDDCCVYCSYGTHKCPSIQDKEASN